MTVWWAASFTRASATADEMAVQCGVADLDVAARRASASNGVGSTGPSKRIVTSRTGALAQRFDILYGHQSSFAHDRDAIAEMLDLVEEM